MEGSPKIIKVGDEVRITSGEFKHRTAKVIDIIEHSPFLKEYKVTVGEGYDMQVLKGLAEGDFEKK